jgi:hypothetical protein
VNGPVVIAGKLHVPTSRARPHRQAPARAPVAPGRVPRVTRLLALAIKLDGEVRAGVIPGYAALARLAHVSRARISQIMNLLFLAPDIQEEILFLPPTLRGRDPVHLRHLQRIALVPMWPKQRRLWQHLRDSDRRNLHV